MIEYDRRFTEQVIREAAALSVRLADVQIQLAGLLAAARAVVEAWYAEKSGKTLGEYQDLMKELRTAVEAVGQEEV